MKKYTDKELKAILNDINTGTVYTAICNNYGTGTIKSYLNYIEWNYYGSSCEKKNINNLRWIIENIFGDCAEITPAIYSAYHINYIPANKKYNAIDLSSSHTNIHGL